MEDAERELGVWSGRSPEGTEGVEPETPKAEEQGPSGQREQHCRGKVIGRWVPSFGCAQITSPRTPSHVDKCHLYLCCSSKGASVRVQVRLWTRVCASVVVYCICATVCVVVCCLCAGTQMWSVSCAEVCGKAEDSHRDRLCPQGT